MEVARTVEDSRSVLVHWMGPTAIPTLHTSSHEELRREAEAQLRRANRPAERDQILEQRAHEV